MDRLSNVETIKIGIDIHGVWDQAPKFFALFKAMNDRVKQRQAPIFEVHVITGIKEELDDVVPEGTYHAWFSIHQQCEDEGIKITYDDKGRPWVEPSIWDRKKAEYCERVGIHMMIDDSPSYGQYFKELETLYLRLENTNRDNWRQDGLHTDDDTVNLTFSIPGEYVRLFRRAVDRLAKIIDWFAIFTPTYWMMNYDVDPDIEALGQHFIKNCDVVKVEAHRATFKDRKTGHCYETNTGNYPYAYACRGRNLNTGKSWDYKRPKRHTIRQIHTKIEAFRAKEKNKSGSII